MKVFELRQFSDVGGDGPCQQVVAEIEPHELRELRQFDGDRPGELVVREVESVEILERAEE
jgi:hypothetical protein